MQFFLVLRKFMLSQNIALLEVCLVYLVYLISCWRLVYHKLVMTWIVLYFFAYSVTVVISKKAVIKI